MKKLDRTSGNAAAGPPAQGLQGQGEETTNPARVAHALIEALGRRPASLGAFGVPQVRVPPPTVSLAASQLLQRAFDQVTVPPALPGHLEPHPPVARPSPNVGLPVPTPDRLRLRPEAGEFKMLEDVIHGSPRDVRARLPAARDARRLRSILLSLFKV